MVIYRMGLIKGVSVIVTYLYDLGTNLELFIEKMRRSNLLHTLKQWGISNFPISYHQY